MIKMPCLFVREFHDKHAFTLAPAVAPGCEWVLAGEGVASRKRDGTACLLRGAQLLKRYDAKRGKQPPPGAVACGAPDPVTGHWPHWVPIDDADRWHAEALARQAGELVDGTYELCGPKVNANPERFDVHTLVRHGGEPLEVVRTFDAIRGYLASNAVEGIVFAHPDGRFAKIRRKDFGFRWPPGMASEDL
jgi:hypothetical protein